MWPSGCGKTTLIRALGLFTDPSFHVSERLIVGGTAVQGAGVWAGVVFQEAPVFGHLTVWDNIQIGSQLQGLSPDAQIATVWYLLSSFGLEGLADRRADSLSGGQRQRLALASVLANRPRLLLLDEPFGALDAITRRQLQDFYLRHVAGRVTAVFVTHDLFEALRVGNEVRVGVRSDSSTIPIPRQGLQSREWEQSSAFFAVHRRLIDLLESTRDARVRSGSDECDPEARVRNSRNAK